MSILAKPTFSSGGPKEAMAAIDVYKQNTEEVVNSYQEEPEQKTGLFDKLKSPEAKDLLNQITSAVKTGAGVAQALARGISSGDYFAGGADALGALGVKGSAAISGMQGVLQQASKINGLVRNLGQVKNLSQLLGSGGAFLGKDGAALTKLASSSSTLERNLSSFSNMRKVSSLYDVSRGLELGAGMSTAVGSMLGDMSPGMAVSYNTAAQSALSIVPKFKAATDLTGRIADAASARDAVAVSNAVTEFTGGTYKTQVTDSAALAGSVAGLAYAGNQVGLPGTFQAVTRDIEDMGICKASALPLMQTAAATGDTNLFMDIAASKVGSQMGSAVPEAAAGIIANAQPPITLAQQEYSRHYDDLSTALDITSPNWQSYTRGGDQLVNAAYVSKNPFMQDLVAAKVSRSMAPEVEVDQSVYPLNPPSDIGIPSRKKRPSFNTAFQETIKNLPANPTTVAKETPPEAFMLLGGAFPDESVDAGLQAHFPYAHKTLSTPVMGIPA